MRRIGRIGGVGGGRAGGVRARIGGRVGGGLAAAVAILAMAAAGAPGVASAQEALVIRGGTVHTMTGGSYVGTVVVANGEIVAAGPSAEAPSGARVIDAAGLHVYPGLFDAGTQLGLTEIGSIDVTQDSEELGDYTPHLQARTAIHPASAHIPVARANGITHTLVLPEAGGGDGGFPGQGSLVDLDGWTVEEMDVVPGAVMVLDWPTIETGGGGWWSDDEEQSYEEAREDFERSVHRLRRWLAAARDYDRSLAGGASIPRDLRLEALARVTRGELPVLARVDEERAIRNVIEFAEEEGLRLILAGGAEAYRVADLLAERAIPVILGPTQALPEEDDRPYDEAYTGPGRLHDAGVPIAFATFNSSDSRTLPYEAAMGVPFGLPREAALRAITVTPAEILGVAHRIGTIQPGRIANLIVTDGDPLEITTRVRHLIIEGREVDTMNRHRELYERYRSRPLPAEAEDTSE